MNNFVDGGLKVNNPSEDGMTKIQDYLKETSPHTDLMVVVSIGCGVFPPQEWSDSADVEKYLFFGKHWLKPWKLIEDAGKLVKLLAEGVSTIIFMSISPLSFKLCRLIILKVPPETLVVVVKGKELLFTGSILNLMSQYNCLKQIINH